MRLQFVLVCAGIVVIAQTSVLAATKRFTPRTELEYSFARNVGQVVGAANACSGIERQRVLRVSDAFTDFFTTTTSSGIELEEVTKLYQGGSAEGRLAVEKLAIDCAKVAREIAVWESVIEAVGIARTNSRPPAAAPATVPSVPPTLASGPAKTEEVTQKPPVVRSFAHQMLVGSIPQAGTHPTAKPAWRTAAKNAVRRKSKPSQPKLSPTPSFWLFPSF